MSQVLINNLKTRQKFFGVAEKFSEPGFISQYCFYILSSLLSALIVA
jgi:hypothetical protein